MSYERGTKGIRKDANEYERYVKGFKIQIRKVFERYSKDINGFQRIPNTFKGYKKVLKPL